MEKMARLLDLLPARGPVAFDGFCEALLESDHSHVAEYLKQLEGNDVYYYTKYPLLLTNYHVYIYMYYTMNILYYL